VRRRRGRGGHAHNTRGNQNAGGYERGYVQNEEPPTEETMMKKKMKEWKEEGELAGLNIENLTRFIMDERNKFQQRQERQAQADREERMAHAEREAKIRELEIEAQRDAEVARSTSRLSNTEGNRRVKIKLPCFEDGEDLEGFLWQFERAMEADEISDEEWSIKLACLLKGKARKVVTQMKHEDVDDYTKLKKELLKKFRLTSEEYRGKLKQVRKNHGESARELMGRIEQYTARV
jgi:hypothetical protein